MKPKFNIRILLILTLSICFISCQSPNKNVFDLSGTWNFELDHENMGETEQWFNRQLEKEISLPGTTDEAGYGEKTVGSDYGILTRVHKYIGVAWYQREIEIPELWLSKEISLFLERVIWESKVFIDGKEIGAKDALATPHVHEIGILEPGNHLLTIRVDNDTIYNIGDKGHAYSEYTQTIWNGIVGKIELRAKSPIHIQRIRTFPEAENKRVLLDVQLSNEEKKKAAIKVSVFDKHTGERVGQISDTINSGRLQLFVPIEKEIKMWDEFTPNLYRVVADLSYGNSADKYETTFGFRKVTASKSHVLINDNPVFLRGNLDCIHFPLTGYPAMNVEEWKRIFKIYKNYGLNHVRFHSWCPPEAAFTAADELGIYIQAEASIWIDRWMGRTKEESESRPEMYTKGEPKGLGPDNPSVTNFVEAEINRVVDTYGNHPSFIMFCIGNELGSSDFGVMGEWMRCAKEKDPRRIYSASTARTVTEHCDYSATHRYPGIGMVRGKVINHTNWDYEQNYSQTPVPTIAHEIGQWPVYPSWDEIEKYTGVVRARNFENFREQAKINGIFEQDEDLRLASGKLATLLYKDEIESFMRTPSCSGIQLLSMQDYQGQGEALVGWLDCFYDSKGIISPEDFRKFYNATVPLVKLPSYIYESGDSLNSEVLLHHFGQFDLRNKTVGWNLESESGDINLSGQFEKQDFPRGMLSNIGNISVELPYVSKAAKFTLTVILNKTEYENNWNIWIYPKNLEVDTAKDVIVTEELNNENLQKLNKGAKVLLIANQCGEPENTKYATWRPLYWSGSFFPGQNRETIGLLFQDEHPAFYDFPTDMHSDWQWWNICKDARGFVLDSLPKDYRPMAQPISDFHFNHKLGSIFELKYGRGKLLVCGYDITQRREDLPEVRQLKYSLIQYMKSDLFQPEVEASRSFLKEIFKRIREAPTNAPKGFNDAILYVQASAKRLKAGNSTWEKSEDIIVIADKVDYKVLADGTWKDNVGTSWFGKTIEIEIKTPEGILGEFYVYFHDWDNRGREGRLNFEGRDYLVGDHDGEGKWIKFNVMREDTNDGKLIFKCKKTSGPNLMITAIAYLPIN
ncbi:sugar-binding domain-containing protein [Bacteroidota bacterium]